MIKTNTVLVIIPLILVTIVVAAYAVLEEDGDSDAITEEKTVVSTVTTFTILPTSTFTREPTARLTSTPVPTETALPSPTVTPTPTVILTPTNVVSATPEGGYTFFGSQVVYVAENLGWRYYLAGCPSGYSGVANIYTSDTASCIAIFPTEVERSGQKYLMIANNWYFAPGSGIGHPQHYLMYVFDDKSGIFDPITYWLELGRSETIDVFIKEPLYLYNEVCTEYVIDIHFGGLKLPSKVMPLTEEEYEVISSRPDLFPVWVRALD